MSATTHSAVLLRAADAANSTYRNFSAANAELRLAKPQRAKLWELSDSVHCSIIGTCLTTAELRRIMSKIIRDDVAGISATVQGRRDALAVKIDPRFDGRNNPYFWIGFGRQTYAVAPGTDLEALSKNRISVTPLKLDLTDEPTVMRYAQLFEG